ncbi:hypothetical protein CIB84_011785 [Bambusicola thoracicus]|uniref:Uncharacterized protein n=1 Tax=Bambusicola thoracicus TaxID=9083 RepID=A0A2P4SK34_BAMTH|nr:hypothetical protein CIB84_011785 [Bambusicola thoracicus]
MLWITWSVG